jgi:glutamate formiminotransferase
MDRIVECVPNFSEGRSPEVVARLAAAVESVAGALVLGTHTDPDHNRSVVTFVAPPEQIVEAALRVVARAAELIDLSAHAGQHPRIGACDVLPFVPVRGVTVEECVALAHAAGRRIWDELSIPVYFYESAALRAERRNLADVRRGGFELLREQIATVPERAPDVGEPRVHPTAGACIVGVRPLLIAYNVTLSTRDLSVAKRIARRVRERDGGLLHLKALGFELESRGVVQVSMNLTSYERTNLHQAFEAVRREAETEGVEVLASELVGLVPQAALDRTAAHFLRLENYSPDLVLENRIAAALERKRGAEGGQS